MLAAHKKFLVAGLFGFVLVLCALYWFALTPALLTPEPNDEAEPGVKSFPTAEGYGAHTVGGRGGEVLFVTNVNDSGPGSLREAVKTNKPRTIIFRVGGIIDLLTPLMINNPYITIAGQTAPGDGICVRGDKMVIHTHDVIVRNFCSRIGTTGGSTVAEKRDAVQIQDAHDVIIDHSSFSWSVDEVMDMADVEQPAGDTHDVTVQWSIIAEPLWNATHPEGQHGFGLLVGGGGGGVSKVSLHHNLLSQTYIRNPNFESGVIGDFVNNLVFNWALRATLVTSGSNDAADSSDGKGHKYFGPSFINIVNNIYKAGPGTGSGSPIAGRIVVGKKSTKTAQPIDDFRVYVRGNIDGFGSSADAVTDGDGALKFTEADRDKVLVTTPVLDGPFDISVQGTADLYEKILSGVGRTVPRRDAVDARIVQDVRSGVGRILSSPADVGGYPAYQSGTPYADADKDGMDDTWESVRGLDPSDSSDAAKDRNTDGYTNLEEFINELAGDALPS